jgi:hypothetical protein
MAKKDEFAGPEWWPIEVRRDAVAPSATSQVRIHFGDRQLLVSRRRRRAGKAYDNTFNDLKETWLYEDQSEVAWLDVSSFQAIVWEPFSGAAQWADRDNNGRKGVEGAVGDIKVFVPKPRHVPLQRLRKVTVHFGPNSLVLSGDGVVSLSGRPIARIKGQRPVVSANVGPHLESLIALLVATDITELVTSRPRGTLDLTSFVPGS